MGKGALTTFTPRLLLFCVCFVLGQVGDVIYIEANSGSVKRAGRCDAYATEFDLEAEEYVPFSTLPLSLPLFR